MKSEKEAQENIKKLESQPKKDYSLKEGEKIHVAIKVKTFIFDHLLDSKLKYNISPPQIITRHQNLLLQVLQQRNL